MDIPVYNIVFNEGESEGGLFGVSLVSDPANMHNFITLSEEVIQLKVKDKEKQIVSGPVLIPNQKIFRNSLSDGKHFITFSEETIENLSFEFLGSSFRDNSWYEHDYSKTLKPTIVESWLVSDSDKDKANLLGFKELPKGTWMMSMKLSDEEWKDYIKTGKAKGFSIDGYLEKKIILNRESPEKEENKMKSKLVKMKNKITKLTKVIMASIDVDEKVLEAEVFEEGKVVYFEDEPYADMKFDYRGYTYSTDSEGVITSVVAIEEVDVEVMDADEEEKEETELEVEADVTVEEDEPSDEVILAIIFDIIQDSPEIDRVLREHYTEEVVELYEEDEKTQLTIDKLFSKERETLNKKITKLKSELEMKPATTKLSAMGGRTSTKSLGSETTLEALSRINKSINK